MSHKKTILIFIDWYSPGYLAGGPIQSVVSLVAGLANEFNIKIITSNSDLDGIPYSNIQANSWLDGEYGCKIYYADRKGNSFGSLKKILKTISFDVVYINSFLSLRYSIIPLVILNTFFKNIPVILAPRGMLGSGALSIKSRKKKLFLFLSRSTGFHSRVIWHATSQQEKDEILFQIPTANIYVIENIPKGISVKASIEKKKGILNACFISRINEKKNLLYALEILSKVTSVAVNYDIYGPIEDNLYWKKCEEFIKQLPHNISVRYRGTLLPPEISDAYSKAHILFLPTLNENYGHAIVESLLCGCPVLISDQTPWNDVEEGQAGAAIPLNKPERFVEKIIKLAETDNLQFNEIRKGVVSYINAKIDKKKIIDQHIILFNECIQNRSKHV